MTTKTQMTILPLETIRETFSTEEVALILETVKPDASLYASKPTGATGRGKYLWRMLAFGISPNPKHHCIPVTADFDLNDDLGGDWDATRAEAKVLNELATQVERLVPIEERHGTLRWGRALGMI